jgi:hypothetical protein
MFIHYINRNFDVKNILSQKGENMKSILWKVLLILLTILLFESCSNEPVAPGPVSPGTSEYDASFALEWMDLTYEIVSLEDIPAPECSRFYGYCGIALYEAVHGGIPGHKSLGGQLREMPVMPMPENETYDWPSVLAATLKIVSASILYQPTQISIGWINDLYNNQIQQRGNEVEESKINRSITYGELLGNAIVEWSNSDDFLATRDLPYEPPKRSINPAFWEPTLPGQHALEPYLRFQRPFCLLSADQCAIDLEFPFDTIPGTQFYEEGMEVLLKIQNLTQDEKDIAFFWEDKAGTGQPPGHWVSITSIAIRQFNLKLDEAAKLYALMGAAIRDAFISCWEAKYRVNLLRPKTYIRDYFEDQSNWNPIVVTPPFPEYTSGHSVVSGAVSKVLTWRFGDNVAFTDDTHGNEPGMRDRNFTSFYHAADEAAWSRLYGGIHFRSAILNGVVQGKLVADQVLATIQFD